MSRIAVCVKWVDLNPDIDPLHGTVEERPHGAGWSSSDLSAVEVALRLGERWGAEVLVACVGPPSADGPLRELLAAGADRALRIEVEGAHGVDGPPSGDVARLLDAAWASSPPDVVVCGDASVDRGSGSVPAFLAHEMGAAQALGLVAVDPLDPVDPDAATGAAAVRATRRLDGGRREELTIAAPAVLSVEGSVATLRRAPLAATLARRDASIEVHSAHLPAAGDEPRLHPWRPRARALPGPVGERALDRIVALTGALVDRTPPRTLELAPHDAAAAILDQLREWGYLPRAD